jgi:2-polyprenyl-3-methyl-5-hydroxy-6-metoxy-1,4-benzoquinol methylase
MKIVKTPAEIYWQDHGGEEWKNKMDKRVKQSHYVNQLGLLNRVFENMSIEGLSILEVGCGFGRVMNAMENAYGVQIDGLDQSTSMLAEAKNQGINDKRLIHANIRGLSRRVKRYDIIFTCEMLIHVHPYQLLSVLETIYKKAERVVVHIETSPVDKFYADDCHAGFWKHDYVGAYSLLGEKVEVISQEGTKHSAYIINK